MARYKKGESGNPAGRPKGTQDKRTMLRQLLDPHAKKLIQKAVSLALEGDTTALRLCLERLIPPLKQRDESITLRLDGNTLTENGLSVINALSKGEVTPSEANSFLQAIVAQVRIKEMDEIEARLIKLEKRIN